MIPDDSRIRLIHLDGDPLCIGEKRNYGCSRAAGEVICNWDDDDHSAPERMADQLQRLSETGKAVTGYRSMRFVSDAGEWWQYNGEANFALGTSLCYRKDWWAANRFPAIQVGEDNQFVASAWAAGQLAAVDAGPLMHATIHTGNTSPRNMGSSWERL